jgi:hypothetical protein
MVSKEFSEIISETFDDLEENLPCNTNILGCKLILTCSACPEQYDVFYNENDEDIKIGYLRLRHGRFYAAYPDCGGEIVYVDHPKGDGIFDDEEREEQLTNAVRTLLKKHKNIPDQTIMYLLYKEISVQYGTSVIVGIYSTRSLAEVMESKIRNSRTYIEEMTVDAEPKEKY